MIEQIIARAALLLLQRKETRSVATAGLAMMAIGLLLLIVIPIILVAAPIVMLSAGMSALLPGTADTIALARQQINYVERLCEDATGIELDHWLETTREHLIDSGILPEHVTVSMPSNAELKIPASEVIILWSAEYEDGAIDSRIREIVDSYLVKSVSYRSVVPANGNSITYAEIKVSLRSFAEVLGLRRLTQQQEDIAWLRYEFMKANNQLQKGSWLGNDQMYIGGDFTFNDGRIPVIFFHQRDNRWANTGYAGENIGMAGCGPTAVAMVVSSLIGETVTPKEIASWSAANGYAAHNQGSYHSLIPNAAEHYGLTVTSGNDPDTLRKALQEGKLAIAIMGPGNFTPSGHFIVLRGITDDGSILVADPVSVDRNERSWDMQTIFSEVNRGAGGGGPLWIIDTAIYLYHNQAQNRHFFLLPGNE